MKAVAVALLALAMSCTKNAVADASAAGEDPWATVLTAFRLTPKDNEEEQSIRAAIYSRAKQFKMDCKEGTDPRLPVCSNLMEIVRRGLPRGNMELYVEREADVLHVSLVGDGHGLACDAIYRLRSRLTEDIASERIRVEAKDPCRRRF
jgi:hypothetical protein